MHMRRWRERWSRLGRCITAQPSVFHLRFKQPYLNKAGAPYACYRALSFPNYVLLATYGLADQSQERTRIAANRQSRDRCKTICTHPDKDLFRRETRGGTDSVVVKVPSAHVFRYLCGSVVDQEGQRWMTMALAADEPWPSKASALEKYHAQDGLAPKQILQRMMD